MAKPTTNRKPKTKPWKPVYSPRHRSRLYGGIFELSSKLKSLKVYMAYRDSDDVYRQENGWAIDDETLNQLRLDGVMWVSVWVRDTGDFYLAPRDWFYDKSKIAPINYDRRGGAEQKVLPLHYWFPKLEGFKLKGSSTSLRRAA